MKPDRCRKILLWIFLFGMLTTAGCGKKKVALPNEQESEIETDEFDGHTEQTGQNQFEQNKPEQDKQEWNRLAGGGTGQITYEVRYREQHYKADDGTDIFNLKLAWPVIRGEAAGIARINDFLESWAQEKLAECEADQNSTRQSALEVYRESRDQGWEGPWGEEYRVSLVKTHAGYVSILLDSYLKEGKAEGTPYRESYLFRLSDGQQVSLTEMTGLSWETWDVLLRERFSKLVEQDREGRYYEDALERLEMRDMKDVGFYFIDVGISFYLPPYEIAPYESGYVEIVVPFEETG